MEQAKSLWKITISRRGKMGSFNKYRGRAKTIEQAIATALVLARRGMEGDVADEMFVSQVEYLGECDFW